MNTLNELAKEGKINQNASVKDGHSIIINASIHKVWALLTTVKKWPEWNHIIRTVQFEGDEVKEGACFKWNLNGTVMDSQVQHIKPTAIFSCTGKSKWVKSIFVWQVEADDNQTIVTLNASAQGVFTTLFENHQKMYHDIINWLEHLKKKAESDMGRH